ncbi:hypothetical protein RRG38_02335 [Mycoplasmopsis felis]|uniref:Ig-specific serine endopeptidase MIP n=1 Tax=Mycoplasmopsis felis TaxID=33923 RepID=UPI002AF6A76D|nr:hypothetical protein [Mycoplasmopsis felis]WQQ02653.1 hypothetical protein RNN91_01040 [Mycoplasmopsis felis]
MKKFKLITLWASSVPITSLMVLSAACDNSQEPGPKPKPNDNDPVALENKKNEARELIRKLKNNSGALSADITTASSIQEIEQVINRIKGAIEDQRKEEIKNSTPEQLKEIAKKELSFLRDKKDYLARIESEVDKEKLSQLIELIKNDLNNQQKLTGEEAEVNNQEFQNIVNNARESVEFDLVQIGFGFSKPKSETLPSEVVEDSANWEVRVNSDYASKIKAQLSNIRLENNDKNLANSKGEVEIFVRFSNPNTDINEITKSFKVSGFKSGSDGIITISPEPPRNELVEYLKKNHLDRYKYDNNKFVEAVSRRDGGNWKSLRNGQLQNTTDVKVTEFNTKAQEVGVSSYSDSVFKGFGVPAYKTDGTLDGLVISQSDPGNLASWVDAFGKKDPYRATGLARKLPNTTYVDIAKQSYSIAFSSYLASSVESERNEVMRLLTNKEDLKELIKKINNTERRDFFLKRLTDNPDANWREKVKLEVFDELKIENNNNEDAAARIYTDYINTYRNQMKKDVDASSLPQEVKNRVKAKIDKEPNLDQLALFGNQQSDVRGTMWLMDYEIKDGEDYPTKFYFGTNLHVADGMIPGLFKGYNISRMKKDVSPVLNKLKFVGLDDNFETFILDSSTIRRVFDGRDYLNKKPADYLATKQKELYKDVEEFIDFAILEIDFSKADLSSYQNAHPNATASNYAKHITNDYKNLSDDKKVKFLNESYLKNYAKIDFPLALNKTQSQTFDWSKLDQLFILGYPLANSGKWRDYYLEMHIDDNLDRVAKYYNTIWINADQDFYKLQLGEDEPEKSEKDKLNRGNFLSYNIGYRTFIDKPGITDAFLSAPVIGSKSNPLDNLYISTQDNKHYINFGLEYTPRWYAPGGGASGSSVRNQRNELVGVYHASNISARTGLAAAFRSEGYDYKGLYGTYNLPQYDLIYGGGKDQKNSYRDAMLKLSKETNGGGITKTWLFKNGFEKTNIPSEYNFTENILTYETTKKTNES